MHAAWSFISEHEMVFSLVFTALIVTMPPPGTKFSVEELYRWIYDFLHQFPNLRPKPPA